jgi:molybdenum cofactor synthesis domain-containing protein
MYRVGILVLSDKGSRGERVDESGQTIMDMLHRFNAEVAYYEVIPDERELIAEKLIYTCDTLKLDLVLTSGGTGFGERDVTPEATYSVVERLVPGIPDAIRYYGLQRTPRAMLSRGTAGIRKKTLIINLPGSVAGVKESMESIIEVLPHGLDVLGGKTSDCGVKSH